MIFFFVLFALSSAASGQEFVHVHNESEYIACEPATLPQKYWKDNYSLRDTGRGYTSVNIYRSNHTYIGQDGIEKIRQPFSHSLITYETGQNLRMRKKDGLTLYTFYSGDSVVVHQIDTKTKKFTTTNLGFHTNQYFIAIKPGNWYALGIEDHTKAAKFAVVGITLFPEPKSTRAHRPSIYPKRSHLLAEYPRHKEAIIRFTNDD